jgi:NAD(P)-dependent dehydrogenase (short-subunit alcohol dehydrogenase family)
LKPGAGKTVLVTGAARRIGAAIARGLAEDGWKVIIHYQSSQQEAEALGESIIESGGSCVLERADLALREDVEALIPRCLARHGALDCLVNNASRFTHDDIATVTWESLEAHLLPNLAAPVLLCRDFSRAFGDRSGGCIINLLDQKIANLNPDFLSYTFSKIVLSGLTQLLALAFAGRIRVCGVAPGVTLIRRPLRAGAAHRRKSWPQYVSSSPPRHLPDRPSSWTEAKACAPEPETWRSTFLTRHCPDSPSHSPGVDTRF